MKKYLHQECNTQKGLLKMHRKFTGVMCMLLSLSLACGCGSSTKLSLSEVDMNTMYIAKNGKMELVCVEDFDKDYYSESDLKDYIEDSISDYNKENGEDKVELQAFDVKKNQAKALITFASPETYEGFEKVDFRLLNLEDVESNMVLPSKFVSVNGGKKVEKSEVLKQKGLKMLIVSEALHVELEGTVKYYSDASLTEANSFETTDGQTAVVIFE